MFQLIEKAGERKAVYSKSDLAYMQARGWRPVAQQVAAILKPVESEPETMQPRVKRKYTRRAK